MPYCRLIAFALILLVAPAAAAPPGLPLAAPHEVGMVGEKFQEIDTLIEAALADGEMAGAVVLISRQGKSVLRRAYGHRQLKPVEEPMTVDTIFDLASLTKPVATATCIMILADRGELEVNAPVANYLPDFAQHGKQEVTVAHLLTHTSGLIADNSLSDYSDGAAKSFERIAALRLRHAPGERFVYSDVGFLVLGRLVEQVSGKPLAEFAMENIFQPLAMTQTTYHVAEHDRGRCASTEQRQGRWLRGEVHDPRAAALGGVAGHAGLFSTADDLARYGQMVLNGGELQGQRVMSSAQISAMLQSREVPGGVRTWGWDRRTGYSSNRGANMSDSALGHGGFTGTGLWIDPEHGLVVIFLSNRLHPDGKGSVNRLIGRIGTIAVESIE